MISIGLIMFSVCLMISGNMPLLGGKRARGNLVHIGGGVLLCLSILTMLAPGNVSFILFVFIFGMIAGAFFFIKGDEPTEKETKLYGFKSSKDELKTYVDAIKGMTAYLLVLVVYSFC